MFGSLANVKGFNPSDAREVGWISSAAPAIEELLESHGTRNTSQWDDDESIAVEALRIALEQGITRDSSVHQGRPETRGFTLGHAGACEFVLQVYKDVPLNQRRWNHRGSLEGADRILIGAPLWVRSMSPDAVVRYTELRAGVSRRRLFARRFPQSPARLSEEGDTIPISGGARPETETTELSQ